MQPAGSRVTCNPAPTGTDEDWVCLAPRQARSWAADKDWKTALFLAGYEQGGSAVPDDGNRLPEDQRFLSFTKGDINLIVTESPEFFRRFLAATDVAKHLNLLDKADRIRLFQAVLYGNITQ